MLIISKSRPSKYHPTYDRRGEQAATQVLRRGMARVALRHKLGDRVAIDANGQPLGYATRLANSTNAKTLAKMSRQQTEKVIVTL